MRTCLNRSWCHLLGVGTRGDRCRTPPADPVSVADRWVPAGTVARRRGGWESRRPRTSRMPAHGRGQAGPPHAEPPVDVRERGANGQTSHRRLFMQLQVLTGVAEAKPLVAALAAGGGPGARLARL